MMSDTDSKIIMAILKIAIDSLPQFRISNPWRDFYLRSGGIDDLDLIEYGEIDDVVDNIRECGIYDGPKI